MMKWIGIVIAMVVICGCSENSSDTERRSVAASAAGPLFDLAAAAVAGLQFFPKPWDPCGPPPPYQPPSLPEVFDMFKNCFPALDGLQGEMQFGGADHAGNVGDGVFNQGLLAGYVANAIALAAQDLYESQYMDALVTWLGRWVVKVVGVTFAVGIGPLPLINAWAGNVGLRESFSYSSTMNIVNGPFGANTDSTLFEQIHVGDPNLLYWNPGSGFQYKFVRQGTTNNFIGEAICDDRVIVHNPGGTPEYLLTDRFGQQTDFNSGGRILSRRNRLGQERTFQYNAGGQLTTVKDPLLATIYLLVYYPSGRVKTIDMAGGYQIGFSYDAEANMSQIHTPATTDRPNGRNLTFEYASGFGDPTLNNNMTKVLDADGVAMVEYTYDTDDHLATVSAGNCQANISWQTQGSDQIRTVTDPRGTVHTQKFTANSGPFAAEMTTNSQVPSLCPDAPSSWKRTYTFDPKYRLMSVVSAEGRRVDITRGAAGNPVELRRRATNTTQNQASDIVETATWTANNLLASHTNALGKMTSIVRDGQGLPLEFKYPDVTEYPTTQQAKSEYTWSAAGQLSGWKTPEATDYSFERDSATGQIMKMTVIPQGGTAVEYLLERNSQGQVVKFTTPSGVSSTATFDGQGFTQKLDGPTSVGNQRKFTHDARGRLVKVTEKNADESGTVDPELPETEWSRTLNPMGRTATETLTKSGIKVVTVTYEHDANSNVTAIVSPAGRRREIKYDERNLPCEVTDGAGTPSAETTKYERSADGLLTAVTDPGGRRIAINRGDHGLPDRITIPSGSYAKRTYLGGSAALAKAEVFDAGDTLLAKREFDYDSRGRLHKVDDHRFGAGLTPSIITNRVEYDRMGRVAKSVDATGNEATINRDWRGAPTSAAGSSGATTAWSRDSDGLPETVETTDGTKKSRTTYVYDDAGRVISATWSDTQNPGSRTSQFQYDTLGRVRVATDSRGEIARYRYDGTGALIRLDREMRDAAGNPIGTESEEATYDDDGRVAKTKDATGNETVFAHDDLGRGKELTFANADKSSTTYNTDGTVATRTDPNGTVISYSYDGDGNLSSLSIARATGVLGPTSITVSRDALGRITSTTDGSTTTAHTYDSLGRLASDQQGTNAVGYTWSDRGLLSSIAYSGGLSISYQRDTEGRINSISSGANVLVTQGWNAAEGLQSRQFSNGVVDTLVSNGFGDLTSITIANSGGTLASVSYGYTGRGIPAWEARGHRGGTGPVYRYDSDGQLVQAVRGSANPAGESANPGSQVHTTKVDYVFGAGKNRATVTTTPFGGTGATVATATSNVHQATSVGGVSRVHDANGNLTDDGTHLYKYDFRNLLHEVRLKSTGALVATYVFDAVGRRVRKTVGGVVTNYVYDGLRVVEERDAAGTVLKSWIYADSLDDPTHVTIGGATYSLHKDRLGSVIAVMNSAGSLVETVDYDEYGNPSFFGPAGALLAASTIGNDVLYTGQKFDAETGLYHYKLRTYDPAGGRFLQRDPLLYVDGLNAYVYVGNSPVSAVDPLGLSPGGELIAKLVDLVDKGLGAEVRRLDRWQEPYATRANNSIHRVSQSIANASQVGSRKLLSFMPEDSPVGSFIGPIYAQADFWTGDVLLADPGGEFGISPLRTSYQTTYWGTSLATGFSGIKCLAATMEARVAAAAATAPRYLPLRFGLQPGNRTVPATIAEQVAASEALFGGGELIIPANEVAAFWGGNVAKFAVRGRTAEVHFMKNLVSGEIMQMKFVTPTFRMRRMVHAQSITVGKNGLPKFTELWLK